MNKNAELIKDLEELVFGLNNQILARAIQCKIFKDKGLLKLEERYRAHLKEEQEYLEKAIEEIIDLGGEINFSNKNNNEKPKIFENPIEYLKNELTVSKDGLAWLKEVIKKSEEEISTYNFLIEYYKDEEEDLNWTKSQLELIKLIGEQNWLMKNI